MKSGTWTKVSIMAGVSVAVIALNYSAFAGTIKVKGSKAGTFSTANFSFDGTRLNVRPARRQTNTLASRHRDGPNLSVD